MPQSSRENPSYRLGKQKKCGAEKEVQAPQQSQSLPPAPEKERRQPGVVTKKQIEKGESKESEKGELLDSQSENFMNTGATPYLGLDRGWSLPPELNEEGKKKQIEKKESKESEKGETEDEEEKGESTEDKKVENGKKEKEESGLSDDDRGEKDQEENAQNGDSDREKKDETVQSSNEKKVIDSSKEIESQLNTGGMAYLEDPDNLMNQAIVRVDSEDYGNACAEVLDPPECEPAALSLREPKKGDDVSGDVPSGPEAASKVETAPQDDESSENVQFFQEDNEEFPIGLEVFVPQEDGKPFLKGKIAWTGRHFVIHNSKLAVVVLDKRLSKASNGKFLGQSLVQSRRDRALMVEVNKLRLWPNFCYGERCASLSYKRRFGHVRGLSSDGRKATVEWDDASRLSDESALDLTSAYVRTEESIVYPVQPIPPERLSTLTGKHRGIQGESNSCYLDTTLFVLFAFSSYWENRVRKSRAVKARDVILHDVVYPLRARGFVPATSVKKIRQLMSDATKCEQFLAQSRDLTETIDALFSKVLTLEPHILTASLGRDAQKFPNSFTIETMPPEQQPPVCTSQHYLESSAILMEFQLTRIPENLILLLPRERGYAREVIPSLHLNLNPIYEGAVKRCYWCSQIADFQCPSMMRDCSAASTFICKACLNYLPSDPDRKAIPLKVIDREDSARTHELELSAVICISHSHYNCFVRCGDEWIFFDSMAHHETFDSSQICIPCVRSAKLGAWIRERLSGSTRIKADPGYMDICNRPFSCGYALVYSLPANG